MKLNLGCGRYKQQGMTNIDKSLKCNPEMLWDLECGLPASIKNGSVDEIHTSHFLEHVENLIPLINDCFRVLKHGGKFHITVPSGHNLVWAMRDPTHKRIFFDQTFMYFCGAYPNLVEDMGITCKFNLLHIQKVSGPAGTFNNVEIIGEDLYVVLQKP